MYITYTCAPLTWSRVPLITLLCSCFHPGFSRVLHYTHNKLIYLFDPLSIVPDMSQATLRNVLCWAVRLSAYNCTCVRICGTNNVWADLLGRWKSPPTTRRLVHILVLPRASAEDFLWPSSRDNANAQIETLLPRLTDLKISHGLWHATTGDF